MKPTLTGKLSWTLLFAVGACASQKPPEEPSGIETLGEYVVALKMAITSKFHRPDVATAGLSCVVNLIQDREGNVQQADFGQCNGSEEEVEAMRLAIDAASPLPLPSDPELFESHVQIVFEPYDAR